MKFLAMLKDSLREAVDTKVFYVMVGMSALLTLVVATVRFTPKAAGKEVMTFAAVPLNVDTLEDFDPEKFFRSMMTDPKDLYQVVEVEPLDGAPDAPSSPFRVVLRAHLLREAGAGGAARAEEHIRQRFGVIDQLRLVDVTEVKQVPPPEAAPKGEGPATYYEARVRPTRSALRVWPHSFSLFFGALPFGQGGVPLGLELFLIENYLVGGLGAWIAVLVSVVITAFFIPNMLRKGTVDLLLVKPIHRTTLLLYKFVGGLIFILVNTAVAVLGVWVALGLRSGVWASGFLLMIFVITFSFTILYAVSAVCAVFTRSAIVAILVTCFVWGLLFVTEMGFGLVEGKRQEEVKENVPVAERFSENWFAKTVYAIHFVLPRKGDLDSLTSRLLLLDLLTENQVRAQKLDKTSISWGESLTVSGVFIAVMLGLACWRFATRDY